MRRSLPFTLASLPAVMMLVLYYSLALHMYVSLAGWPTSIGAAGFHGPLYLHAAATVYFAMGAVILSVTVLPATALVLAVIGRCRHAVPFIMLACLLCILAFIATQFAAPKGFLYWWHD
jgi:hypothetical protein